MIGKFIKEGSKHAAYALLFGKFLKRQSGARLQSPKELEAFLGSRNTGLLIDGAQGRLSERESFQNVCVIARVGAGKTSRYIIPNVLDKASQKCSIVINDPKGEVFAETSGFMQSKGFKVIAINPEDLPNSASFNPLLEAKNEIEIEQVAEILIKAGSGSSSKDQFWDNGAIRLISVLLKLLQRAGRQDPAYYTLGNLYHLLQNFGSDGTPLDEFVIQWAYDPSNPDDSTLWEEWKGATTGNSNAVQSFALTALTALRAFTNRNLVALTASSSVDLEEIRREKTVIYFITPPHLTEYYGFWTSVFFRSVFNASMRQMPGPRTLPLYVLYDEFGHSTIPSFVSVANTIRGYKVSLSIVLQSLSQLSSRYGADYARSIQGGFMTYLAYAGSDQDTARFFEAIAGKVVDVRREKIEDVIQQRQEYNLLNADEVRRIGDTQAILVSANRHPALLETTPYFVHRQYSKIPRRFGAARVSGNAASSRVKRIGLS
ncbi:type IV secretory system conjugative DNA transfer family protein [Sulfitobacter pontiacus]|uniref:type IV secretory system conjugative DNA transfer family protein n=1 Tax=Sulfitobacter pontiacus TaxID=60137 RepID=UPI0030ED51D9